MQQQQAAGGTQFGAPPPETGAPSPSSSGASHRGAHMLGIPPPSARDHHRPPPPPEAASPISSRPPPPSQHPISFDEMVPVEAGSFPDEGGAPGNRWPRQETLSLLKIRSEMDAAFRDATLKGPLWEDVSSKLAELGHTRSAKKCKEKFENVHKYYKRTKEGRAGRQDGKSYRFFTQLEALYSPATTTSTSAAMSNPVHLLAAAAAIPATPLAVSGINVAGPSSSASRIQTVVQPLSFTPPRPAPDAAPTPVAAPTGISGCLAAAEISFSSDTFSTSSYDSDDEGTQEGTATGTEGLKRKRGGGSGGSRKMMTFFEGLMRQVMERQEAMQQRFLETIEKREQDRVIREEAWKRQEMESLNREHELLAQERAMAASRDAAIISFLQKMNGGQAIFQLPPAVSIPAAPLPPAGPNLPPTHQTTHPPQLNTEQPHPKPQPPSLPPPLPPPPQQQPPYQQKELPLQQHHQTTEVVVRQQAPPQAPSTTQLVPHYIVDGGGTFGGASVSSSRWPKSEVHALIKLRSALESRYHDAGPKGLLWEEISTGMFGMGYNRSSKRCKEKWENINKYFKKVKESNRKRPEDANTCPYFHQLDELYRKRTAGGSSSSTGSGYMFNNNPSSQELDATLSPIPQQSTQGSTVPPPPQPPSQPDEMENKNGSNSIQIQTRNGGLTSSLLELGKSGVAAAATAKMNKPKDIVKELMEQNAAFDDYDSDDNLDQDDDEEEEDGTMQYEIQFQRLNVGDGGVCSGATAAAKTAGSFLAMVQ